MTTAVDSFNYAAGRIAPYLPDGDINLVTEVVLEQLAGNFHMTVAEFRVQYAQPAPRDPKPRFKP